MRGIGKSSIWRPFAIRLRAHKADSSGSRIKIRASSVRGRQRPGGRKNPTDLRSDADAEGSIHHVTRKQPAADQGRLVWLSRDAADLSRRLRRCVSRNFFPFTGSVKPQCSPVSIGSSNASRADYKASCRASRGSIMRRLADECEILHPNIRHLLLGTVRDKRAASN